jgi:hypothetical protein
VKKEMTMKKLTPNNSDKNNNVSNSDAVPMMYVPSDYFTNTQLAIEDAIGHEKYVQILYEAGYKSAYHWCEKEAESQQLTGIAVFEHYLNRLSQHGWGAFSFESVDAATGHAQIKLEYSSFVLSQPEKPGKLCNMFAGWFAGAMDWSTQRHGHFAHTNCEGIDCAATFCSGSKCAGNTQSYCIFSVKPSALESQPV